MMLICTIVVKSMIENTKVSSPSSFVYTSSSAIFYRNTLYLEPTDSSSWNGLFSASNSSFPIVPLSNLAYIVGPITVSMITTDLILSSGLVTIFLALLIFATYEWVSRRGYYNSPRWKGLKRLFFLYLLKIHLYCLWAHS